MLLNSISSQAATTTRSSQLKRRSTICPSSTLTRVSPKCSCEHVRAGKMSSRAPKKLTIKKFAHEYLVKINFIDIYGRNIGHDYSFILDKIKEQFPSARTSRRLLQDMAYILKRSERLPMRRLSRRAMAEDYAMALLLKRSGKRAHDGITTEIRKKFPGQHVYAERLRSLELRLKNRGFTIPPRPQ